MKKNQYLAIISQVIRADSLSFGMKNDLAAGAKTKMVIGNYQIALRYMCENFTASGGLKAQDAFFTYNMASFSDTISIHLKQIGNLRSTSLNSYNFYSKSLDTISISKEELKIVARYNPNDSLRRIEEILERNKSDIISIPFLNDSKEHVKELY